MRSLLTVVILLTSFVGTHVVLHAQEKSKDEPSEESMAAYADAANFQTGGAIDLAIEGWVDFLKEYPDHKMAPQAAHYLGVCYMQKENPNYVAASKSFDKALKEKKYELREESLANHGWCLYASSGEADNRDRVRLKRSIETFKTLQKEFPKSPFLDRAMFYSGEAAYGMGEAKQAIQYYNKMLAMSGAKDSPLRCDALYARGVAYEELDQFDQAFASYKQLIESCKTSSLVTDVHLRTGDIMILRKEYGKAIDSFASAIKSTKSEDDLSYAIFRQAFAMVQSDRPGEAAEKYETLLKDYPNSPYAASAVLASAQSTYRSGDIKAASERFRKVLDQNNVSAATEAAHWLARIEISQGRAAQAAKIAKKQLSSGAEGAFATDLKLDLAEALSMDPKTVPESMKLFEKTYRDSPDDALASRALYNAAFSALQAGDPKKALALALEFIKKFPKDTLVPDVRFVAAEGQLLTGDLKNAAGTYKTLLATTSKDSIQRPTWLLRAAATYNSARQFDDTIRILNAEMDQFPEPTQKAEANLLIGRAHLMAGRASEAAKSFKASQSITPGWNRAPEAYLLTGQAQLTAGQKEAAKATWEQLIKIVPKNRMADQARYKLAQMNSAAENYPQAIRFYDEILKSKQDAGLIAYAQYGKGWALMQTKKFKPALESLEQMLSQNKQHPLRNDATLARGIVYRNLKEYDKARLDLEAYLSLPPKGENLGHVLYELALIDQKEKKPGQAAKKLGRLVKEVPNYPSMAKVLYELGWSLQEDGDDKAAVQHFKTLVSKYPKTSFVAESAYFVGQKYYAAKNWKPAAKHFEIATNTNPDKDLSEKAFYRLGWSYFKSEDYQSAENAFTTQTQRHGNDKLAFDAFMMIGECRFKRGEYKEALAGYRQARDKIRKANDTSTSVRDPAGRQVRELVFLHGGQCAGQLKSWNEAIEWFNELRERFPSSAYLPQVFYETGFAHQQKGDREQALKFFAEVADNYRNELAARARFMIGEIHFAAREFDRAIPEFQRVMFGYGADKAPKGIKNWQAKSGFEAGRCSELLMQSAKTENAKSKAKGFAQDFFDFVVEKHPDHELAAKANERIEALSK